MTDVYEIYRWRYQDKKAKVRFSVYSRTKEFADKLIARYNTMGFYNLKPCRLGHRKKVIIQDITPYAIETKQYNNVEDMVEAFENGRKN